LTRLSIENIVKGMGIEKIGVIDPFKYHKSLEVIKEVVSHKGISVLISRAACPLYERTLPHGKKERPFYVNQDKCKNHRDCLTRVACPAFYLENEKVFIDAASCTGCMLCVQICPENAILPVKKERVQ
jgi:indolepyruvate ferredoxin oxidoreductase alpha subunit